MKLKIFIFIVLVCISQFALAQNPKGLINNGANVQIANGANIVVSGADGNVSNLTGATFSVAASCNLFVGGVLNNAATFTNVGKVFTTKTLNAPNALNIGGLGFELTTATTLSNLTLSWFGTAQTAELNGGNSIERYYELELAAYTVSNATIVFHYEESELNGLTESGLMLWTSSDGNTWTPAGGTLSTSNNTVTLTGVTLLKAFYTLGAVPQYTIGGNAGIGGALITYTGGSTTANGSGSYSFTVNYNWSGTVTPSKVGYTFTPTSQSFSNVTSNQTQNFTATATVSGTIWNGSAWSNLAPDATKDAIINGTYTGDGFIAKSLTVNAGKIFNPSGKVKVINNFANAGTTIVQGNGELNLQGTNTNTGTERLITTRVKAAWSYISSPIMPFAVQNTFSTDYLYRYNEASPDPATTYVNFATGQNTVSGQGMLLWAVTTGTKTFTGKYNQGSVTFPLTFTPTSADAGWNLAGNPYPASIYWSQVYADNTGLDPIYKVWVSGGFISYNALDGTGAGSNVILPTGVLFVKTPVNGNITFQNTHKNMPPAKETTPSQCFVGIENETYSDKIAIAENISSNFNFEEGYDSEKWFSLYEEAPQIYALTKDGKQVDINSIPQISENETVAIGFTSFEQQTLTLTFEKQTLRSGISVYLEDTYTGNYQQLNANSTYTFLTESGTFDDRFVLHFTNNVTNVNDLSVNQNVYSYENQIYVNVSSETKVEIYDVNGRLLRMKNVNGFTAFDNFLAGVYMVKTISEGKVEVTKVFVN